MPMQASVGATQTDELEPEAVEYVEVVALQVGSLKRGTVVGRLRTIPVAEVVDLD